MTAAQMQAQLGKLNVSSEASEEGRLLGLNTLSLGREAAHLESALPPQLARRVVEEAISLARPVRARLTVEGKGQSASVKMPIRVDPGAAPGFRLETPGDAEGVSFVLHARPNGQGMLRFNVRYAGLPVRKALSCARFLRALYWEEGTLYLTRLEPREERFEILDLPLPLNDAGREETEDRVRFLEALDEIGKATGAELVHPSEVDADDLKNIDHVLKVVRGGWVALAVTDFTTPMKRDGVENILNLVAQKGEVLRAFAMTAEWDRRQIFDAWVDLGPLVHYVSGARLATPRSELEEWLAAANQDDGSFDVKWEPANGALVHALYYEWPKPSIEHVRRNLKAFEDEYGMSSAEFRRAWENGEDRARNLEDADVWISFQEAQEALEHGA